MHKNCTMKLYLDTRRPLSDGRYPLRISVGLKGKSFFITTNINLAKDQFKNGKITNHPRKGQLNNFIQRIMLDLEELVVTLKHTGEWHSMSFDEVKSKMQSLVAPRPKSCSLSSVLQSLLNGKSVSTISGYESVIKFFGDVDVLSITKSFVSEKFSASTLKDGSKKMYASKLTALLNHAKKNGFISNVPDLSFDFKQRMIHRSTDASVIRRIIGHGGYECDMFALTFYLIGINTEDLLHVRKVENGRINYVRAKTKHPFSIRVQPEALAIIDRYKDDTCIVGSRYSSKNSFLHNVNANLKELFPEISVEDRKLSLYWARHSWATIAAELDIPREIIASALGHTWSDVTSVYIASNQKKVDDANRKVIDYVNNKGYLVVK